MSSPPVFFNGTWKALNFKKCRSQRKTAMSLYEIGV